MSAWFLAALLCAPVSAQVVETGGAAVPVAPVSGSVEAAAGGGAALSPIPVVPGAATLAPSLNTASAIRAFADAPAASRLPAGAVGFAPALPALPAAAAVVGAVPGAAPAPTARPADDAGGALTPRDPLSPPSAPAKEAVPAVAANLRSDSGGAAGRLAAGGVEFADILDEAGSMAHISVDGALAAWRRLFDRDGSRSALTEGVAAEPSGAATVSGGVVLARAGGSAEPAPSDGFMVSRGEILRDAVASPVPAAPGSGAAFSFSSVVGSYGRSAARFGDSAATVFSVSGSAAPVSLSRLTLELGDGLTVTVRAALGLPARVRARPSAAALGGAPAAELAAARTPVTSTEWLERRGLLESLSASEAAAEQTADALSRRAPAPVLVAVSARASAATSLSAFVLDSSAPARVPPLVWWSLAFLPAAFVLLKELQ